MADYVKLPEVARRLDVSEKTTRRMVKSGKLPAVFIGGAYRVSEEDLAAYLESARVEPGKALASPSLEPSLNDALEDERRLSPWQTYRDELRVTAWGARNILEKVPSFSRVAGQDVSEEALLYMWNGTINALQEDALTRKESWREALEAASGGALPQEEKDLVDEVRRWLESYEDTVEKLRARLNEEWMASKAPGELLQFPLRRAG